MEGWKLQQGIFVKENISYDEIWQIFNFIFSTKSVNRTSYKFAFIKALIESVFDAGIYGNIALENIFSKFTHIYWSLIVKHKLKQGDKGVKGGLTGVEKIFIKYIDENPGLEFAEYDSISEEIRSKIEKEVLRECKKYVVGAIYGDSEGVLYSFSLKDNSLQLNPNVYGFIKKYNGIILRLNHYEWIKFLEKVNEEENCYSIAIKLDEAAKRCSLKVYKDLLYTQFEYKNCFYCGKQVVYSNIHVDHFIPWAFIRNDRLWNFVISCSACNLAKNAKLAHEYYLSELIKRDEIIREFNNDIVSIDFKRYDSNLLKEVYKSAIFNGFEYGWNPKGFIAPKEIECCGLIKNLT